MVPAVARAASQVASGDRHLVSCGVVAVAGACQW